MLLAICRWRRWALGVGRWSIIGHLLRNITHVPHPEAPRPLNFGRPDGYRRTVRAALAVAVRRELLPLNPALGRMDAIPDRRYDDDLVIWEPDETARFLEYVRGDRLAALYEVAAFSGLRRAELCGLRWSDLTDDGAGARIRQTVVELTRSQAGPGDLVCPTCGAEHVGRLIKGPKSRAGRRWVPLAAPAREALRAHPRAQQGERGLWFRLPRPRLDLLSHRRRPDTAFRRHEGVQEPCPRLRSADDPTARHQARRLLTASGWRRPHRGGSDDPRARLPTGHAQGVWTPDEVKRCRLGRSGLAARHKALP